MNRPEKTCSNDCLIVRYHASLVYSLRFRVIRMKLDNPHLQNLGNFSTH
jgi:hypothetical protein